MPLTPQFLRLLHITISMQAFALLILITMMGVMLRTSPEQVMNEVKKLRTEVNASNEAFRTDIVGNRKDLAVLKTELHQKIEDLKKASRALETKMNQ